MVKIETQFFKLYSKEKTLGDSSFFDTWESAEIFLFERIELKKNGELFEIIIGEKRFVETKKGRFLSLEKIKTEFELLQEKSKNITAEKGKKRTRFEIRLTEAEKNIAKERAEKCGLTLSEYSRQMILNGKVIRISKEEKFTLNTSANNFNQMLKIFYTKGELETGELKKEWLKVYESFRNLIIKYGS